jgi:opacity protein-like surface antigen
MNPPRRSLDFPLVIRCRYDASLSSRARMQRMVIGAVILSCLASTAAEAQQNRRVFGGGVAGVSTLSADARSEITTDGADVSLYKPENGPALNVFLGMHVREYVTVQTNYIWNRNHLALTSVRSTALGPSFYEQPQTSSQHAIVGDLLVYFREQRSVVRPYLSVGVGVVRLETKADGPARSRNAVPPAETLRATRATLRVAVGLDLKLGQRWSVRYSFSESLSGNPIGAQLSPPGQRNLANFQNLFGVVYAL